MSLIDVGDAIEQIRGFNGHAEALANDRLMHRIFSDRSPGGPSVAERVVLLDKLWATQMFWQADHALKVIESLRRGESRIIKAAAALTPDTLEHQPSRVIDLALWAMPIALGHDPKRPKQNKYAPYAFASKFLHWTAPHVFPIVDGPARQKINLLQRSHGLRPRVLAENTNGWRDDYPRWIRFYSTLLGSLSAKDRRELSRADWISQPAKDRCENSLLRILDKAFYWG